MTRALPGSVVVFAALTIPELSVGAGDLGEGRLLDDPPEPVRASAPRQPNNFTPTTQNAPFAGVRYASRLTIDAPNIVVMFDGATPLAPAPVALPPVPQAVGALTAPSVPVAVSAPFVSQVRAGQAMGTADLAVLDAGPLPLVSLPIEALELAPIALPEVVATSLPARGSADAATAFVAVADAPVPDEMLGRANGSFTALLPPEEQAALRTVAVSAIPVAAVMPAMASASELAAPRPAALVASPPAIALTNAPVAPVSGPSAQPMQQRAPVPAPVSAPASAPAVQLVPLPQTKPPVVVPGLGTKGDFQLDIQAQLVTRVDGKTAGKVDFQQTSTGLLVRLGSIVEVLGDRYEPAQIARIRSSSAGNVYLPLSELQAQGIPISYDPVYDEFNVGLTDTRPKAARKVHMDQISAPERGLGSTGVEQVRR